MTQRQRKRAAAPAADEQPTTDTPVDDETTDVPTDDVTETPADESADPAAPAADEQPTTGLVRVRILQGVAGLDFSWTPGEIVDMSEQDAAKWADGERAELAD